MTAQNSDMPTRTVTRKKRPEKKPAAKGAAKPAAKKTESKKDKPKKDKESSAPKRVALVPKPVALVRSVIQAEESLKALCILDTVATPTEVHTLFREACDSTGDDPVNVESDFRLLEGLGLGRFVTGRRGTATRFIWSVGNIAAVVAGNVDEYSQPLRASSAGHRSISVAFKMHLSAEERGALADEMGKDILSRDELKEWGEEVLRAAIGMLCGNEADAGLDNEDEE